MSPYCKYFPLLFLFFGLKAQVPTATIAIPAGTLCTGALHSFSTVTSNSPAAYSWTIFPSGSVTVVPDRTSPGISLNFARGGIYTLSLQVSSPTGSSVVTRSLNISQSAVAAFNASLNSVGFPNQMILTNFSTFTVSNLWLYNDTPVTDTARHAVKDYTASGSYSLTLIAFGANGCNDTTGYAFRISDSSGITLPNIFTPNGDSINEVYKPIARGIKTMKAHIFNRYGTIIHSWDKVNGFWDGYTTSGEPCQAGVYFCVLEATGFDGKSYKLSSRVTLVR